MTVILIFALLLFGLLAGILPAAADSPLASVPQGTVICLDPGHPSEVGRGTRGRQTTEIRVAWREALLVRDRLERDGMTVVLTKSRINELVRNRQRAETANRAGAALLVRLHCDAMGGSGAATYYPGRTGTSGGVRGPSPTVMEQSRRMALLFHHAMVRRLAPALRDRGLHTDASTQVGSRQGALTGSIFSQVPVLLVEMCVLTNPHDEAFVTSPEGAARLAEAITAGIEAAVAVPPSAPN